MCFLAVCTQQKNTFFGNRSYKAKSLPRYPHRDLLSESVCGYLGKLSSYMTDFKKIGQFWTWHIISDNLSYPGHISDGQKVKVCPDIRIEAQRNISFRNTLQICVKRQKKLKKVIKQRNDMLSVPAIFQGLGPFAEILRF